MSKHTMAYKSKGMKLGSQGESKAAKSGDQSMAPATKPSMKHKEPSGPFSKPASGAKAPEFGDQSKAPDHKKKALPMQDAPPGVAGVNGGSPVAMPKGGGVGESEV